MWVELKDDQGFVARGMGMSGADRWGLLLKGHPFDLDDWRAFLQPPHDPSVTINREETILRWSGFDGLEAPEDVQEAGASLLDQLNGAMAITCRARPIHSNGVVEFNADGTIHRSVIIAVGAAEARARAGAIGVAINGAGDVGPKPRPQPSFVQKWIDLGEEHEELADALVYFGRSEWFDIFKAIECLEDWVGGEDQLRRQNWVSKEQLKNVKRMANSVRHRQNGKHTPPEPPVTLKEAKQLVGTMIGKAFDEAIRRSAE